MTTLFPPAVLERLRFDYLEGAPLSRLTRKYNFSEHQIKKALTGLGVQLRTRATRCPKLPARLKKEAVAAYTATETLTVKDLAASYGVCEATMLKLLCESNVKIRKRNKPLSFDEIEEICDLYLQGYSSMEIGTRFGRDHSTVCSALKKRGVQLRPKGALCDSVQAMLFQKGSFKSERQCYFYVYELRGWAGYVKPGIAFDPGKRAADQYYGAEIVNIEFETRVEAYVFEQAFLAFTKKDRECPAFLADSDWAGKTEVRKLADSNVAAIVAELVNLLDEFGLWEFAAKLVPMTNWQLKECLKKAS